MLRERHVHEICPNNNGEKENKSPACPAAMQFDAKLVTVEMSVQSVPLSQQNLLANSFSETIHVLLQRVVGKLV